MSNDYPVLSSTPGRRDTDLGGTDPAAADITDVTATGIALITAASAAAARTALSTYSAAEVDAEIAALGVTPLPAVTSITFTNTGSSKQFRIDVETRVGGVLQACVMSHLRLTYLPLDPAQFGLVAGLQQENITPYIGGGDIAVTSYMRAIADLNGLMRVEFTGKTAGRVITAEAWTDAPQSPHVTATHTVPA